MLWFLLPSFHYRYSSCAGYNFEHTKVLPSTPLVGKVYRTVPHQRRNILAIPSRSVRGPRDVGLSCSGSCSRYVAKQLAIWFSDLFQLQIKGT